MNLNATQSKRDVTAQQKGTNYSIIVTCCPISRHNNHVSKNLRNNSISRDIKANVAFKSKIQILNHLKLSRNFVCFNFSWTVLYYIINYAIQGGENKTRQFFVSFIIRLQGLTTVELNLTFENTRIQTHHIHPHQSDKKFHPN